MLYISGLAAPHTVNTMPEDTLLHFADHGTVPGALSADPAGADAALAAYEAVGIDIDALGHELQVKGAQAFVDSWNSLMGRIETKAGQVAAG